MPKLSNLNLHFNLNLGSGYPVYGVSKQPKIVFHRGALPPWTPNQGLALDPPGALTAPRPPARLFSLPADHLASGYAPGYQFNMVHTSFSNLTDTKMIHFSQFDKKK